MSAGSSSGTAAGVVAASALDFVTVPLQAPFLVGMVASQPSLVSGDAKGKSTPPPVEAKATPPPQVDARLLKNSPLFAIHENPSLLLTHRESISRNTVRIALMDRTTPYSADLLWQLGKTNEWTRLYVAASPRCPPALLDNIWRELPTLPDTDRPIAAASLVSNPNIPIAWLVEIMKRRDLYGDAASKASGVYYLGGRGPPFRPGTLPAAVPQPPGK